MQQKDAGQKNDQFDVIGEKMAFDLRISDQQQLIIAEKIIAEIIYYGKLKKLSN